MGLSQSLVWMRFLYKPAPTGAPSSLQAQPGDRASQPRGADSPDKLIHLLSVPEGHQSPWIHLCPPPSLSLVFGREDPAACPQPLKQTPPWFLELFIPHVLENININRSAQKFFHLLLPAKGSLCCSARLESVMVTFKGFPSLSPPPPTDHKPSHSSSWNLHAHRIPESLSLENTSKFPTFLQPPWDPRAPFPPVPVWEGAGPHWPNPKAFSHSPLFPSSFCMTHTLSQSIFPELSRNAGI